MKYLGVPIDLVISTSIFASGDVEPYVKYSRIRPSGNVAHLPLSAVIREVSIGPVGAPQQSKQQPLDLPGPPKAEVSLISPTGALRFIYFEVMKNARYRKYDED